MAVKLKSMTKPDDWRKVDLYGGQDIEVLVRRPEFLDQLAAWSAQSRDEGWISRIKSTVIDWRGVLDESDQPVPFSFDMLQALLSQYPQATRQILDIVADMWITLAEDDSKNLPVPSADGGTATTTETTNSTVS